MKRLFVLSFVFLVFAGSIAYADGGLLPKSNEVFGEYMPAIEFAIERKPDSIVQNQETTVYEWENATDSEYYLIGAYFAACGCSGEVDHYSDGVLTVNILKATSKCTFTYDVINRKILMNYPKGTRPEEAKAETKDNIKTIFPELSSIITENNSGAFLLPSIGSAIGRLPNHEIINEKGDLIQEYDNFKNQDYQAFSYYLQMRECEVIENSVEGDTITFKLQKGELFFSLVYDHAKSKATVIYPAGTKAECITVPSSTPSILATTPKPEKPTENKYYTENECYDIAINYLKKQLKNPESLQVHSSKCTEDDSAYNFIIDYSAQNGFGGYSREKYYVVVDRRYGIVQSAFTY